jgi:hypothetical protein
LSRIRIIGAGPAGSTAAISALLSGGEVDLIEKSKFPRHKVCGEFLSPEIVPVLERLGVWGGFEERNPALIRRMELHFGSKPKISQLPEPAYGLSRFAYDHLLYNRAIELGARPSSLAEFSSTPELPGVGRTPFIRARPHGRAYATQIRTTGRRQDGAATRGKRLFGFKAHFTGPAHDAVELYFFGGCYVGINCVENGITNVCGLAPETLLNKLNFEIDELIGSSAALSERLSSLSRSMKWLHVGPLVFQNSLNQQPDPGIYSAGDALSFVDPFTGSGLLSAAITGELAGSYAARSLPSSDHVIACRKALVKPFGISRVLRALAGSRWAEHLSGLVPGEWLYRLTRPRTTG